MKKTLFNSLTIVILTTIAFGQTPVFINEIHYDNAGGDTGEAIEIAGPAGTDLTGWSLVLYNGAGGGAYDTETLTGIIPDLCNGGVLSFPIAGIQNGTPDGIALISPGPLVVQFLSYEGIIIATDGPANGMTSTDIGVDEDPAPAIGQSLQLSGTGTFYEDFIWVGPIPSTLGLCNFGQSLPVELSSFTAKFSLTGTLLKWTTESEIENLGFILERKTAGTDWQEIVSYKQDETLLGQGSVSFATDYEYVDQLVQQGNTYEYRLADVDYHGVVTYHANREVFVESAPLAAIANNFTVMAYPNPFNPSTTIRYSVTSSAIAHIAIYDITGKIITTLINKEQPTGWYEIQWNGTNQNGKDVPGGVYLSRAAVGKEIKTSKLILLR